METSSDKGGGRPWFWIVLLGGLALLVIIAIIETKARRQAVRDRATSQEPLSTQKGSKRTLLPPSGGPRSSAPPTPAEVVSNKVSHFGRQRREITYAFAAFLFCCDHKNYIPRHSQVAVHVLTPGRLAISKFV